MATVHDPWGGIPGHSTEKPYDPYMEQAEYELTEMEPQQHDFTDIKDTGDFSSRNAHTRHFKEWSPRIFRMPSLVIFVVFLLVLISLAEVFVRRSPYPAPTSSALTFLWTYLPPAVVVLVDWVWQSYDLEIKSLLPWALLYGNTSLREQPWTLDYRSMLYPRAVWYALRHKHFVVLLTSAGFWVVAVASVMSTSLWTIESLSHSQGVPLAITSAMSPTADTADGSWQNETYIDFFLAYQLFNLSMPRWIVNSSVVLESFELADMASPSSNVTLLGQTKAYSATLACAVANVSSAGNATTTNFMVDVDAAGCSAQYELHNAFYVSNLSDVVNNTDTIYFGFILPHTCPGATNSTTVITSMSLVMDEARPYSVSVACVPQYDQTTMTVTVPPSSTSPLNAFVVNHSQAPFSYPGGDNFLQVFNNNTASLLGATWNDVDGLLFPHENVSYAPWFELLQLLNYLSPEALLDQDVLLNASQDTYAQLWAAYALHNLFAEPADDHASISGFAETVVSVLQARTISVRALQAILAVLAVDVILIYVLRPRTKLPLDPSSLAGMAALLEMSDSSVHAALHGTGELTGVQFHEEMKKWRFTTTTENGFTIRAIDMYGGTEQAETYSQNSNDKLEQARSSKSMWRPVVLHPISQLFVLSTLAVTIAVLETLYRLSLARSGLGAATSGLDSYWWTYAAPTYVAVLGVLTACYDFHARAVQPYVAMIERPQPVQKSLSYNPAAHTGFGLLWHSLRFRNLVGVTTAISLLIIPFMKIAVAGLLFSAPRMVTSVASLAPMTTFNSTFNATDLYDNGFENAALQVAEIWPLTQAPQYGLPLPAWTTTSEAIGEVNLSSLTVGSQQNASLTVSLPIFSSVLDNCTALDPDEYEITNLADSETLGGGPGLVWFKDSSSVNKSCVTALMDLPGDPSYFGQVSGAASGPVFCAGVYFIIYGFSTGPEVQNVTNATVVTCVNNMTISNRPVTLGLSGSNYSDPVIMSIGDVDSNDVEAISGIANVTAAFDIGFSFIVPPLYINTEGVSFDVFFEVLTLEYPSEPLGSFSNPDILIPAIQGLWSSFWAFWAGSIMRIPVEPSVDSIDALISTQQSRICQDWVTTRVMQALLSAILLCDIISTILLRNSGRALPKAPYSIGTQMCLLVDSSLLDLVSQQREEKNMLAAVNRSLEAHLFYLGWSRDNGGDVRFGIEREDAP